VERIDMKIPDVAMYAGLAWPVVSAVANAVLRWKTDEEWVAFGERSPKLASLVRLLRATGLDPVKAMAAIRALFAPRPGPPQALPPAPPADHETLPPGM
jgi:hypothetical protein